MCPQEGKRYQQIVHGSETRPAEKKKTTVRNQTAETLRLYFKVKNPMVTIKCKKHLLAPLVALNCGADEDS